MIKHADYHQMKALAPTQLVDALATALGFKREGNEYVKHTRSYKRKAVVQKGVEHKKKRKYGTRHEQFSLGTYRAIMSLPMNERADITDEMHRCGLSLKETTSRIASWASFNRKSGTIAGHYRVYRESWRIFVTRFK